MQLFLKPVVTAAAAVLLSLCFAVTSRSQSMPGYQAPAKPKAADNVSVAEKAKRGEVPLSKLYSHLKADPSKTNRLPPIKPRDRQQRLEKRLQVGVVRTLPSPLNPLSDSVSYTVAEGEVRVASIVSEGALYTRIQFKDFSLPAGARVFVYPAEKPDEFFGPYEGKGPWNDGSFWTPAISGDQIIIEYTTPTGTGTTKTPFKISDIAHIYKNVGTDEAAGACNLEVPAEWANVAKSVGMLQFVTGGFVAQCTGTLLNDTDTSTNHYVLSANHCISSQSEAQSVTVYWNYNTGDTPPGGTPTTNGSNLMVTGSASDFTLLRLTGGLPGGLFFSGWDATALSTGTSVTGIHHPEGSHKRISFGATNANCSGGLPGPCQNFTGVTWNPNGGTTEPGSSGSGLWKGSSANPMLVGTLTGGGASCDTPTQSDYYGRFSVTYPSVASFLEGTNCVTSLSPTNQNFSNSGGGSSFNVNAPGGCNWTSVTNDSWITITPPSNGTGNGSISFTVQANNGPQRSGSIVVGGQVFLISQDGGGACAATPISFGQTINGTLSTSDCPLEDGSYYDVYSFSATAGTQVSVFMQSSFDTFLFLNNPDGSILATDDDGGGGTNSRIPAVAGFITLPTTGTYTIWANSFDPGVTGAYSLTLNGSAPATRTLTVASSNPNSGVTITVSPNDNGGLGNGTTPFPRIYNPNINVHLQAPAIAPGGSIFQEWRRDGVFFTSNATTIVVMDVDHTMTAVYRTPNLYTVTFVSSPTNGVDITVSPNDNGGFGSGTTQFTRNYNEATVVNLFAPATDPTGRPFQIWRQNGSDYSSTQNISVTITSSFTMTAVYRVPPVIYTEENTNNAVALNSVTFLRGPFRVVDPNNFSADQNTRVVLLTSPLGLTQADLSQPNVVMVEAGSFIFPVEAVGPLLGVPGLTGSYLVFKLPNNSPTGAIQITVRLRGLASDPKTITIIP